MNVSCLELFTSGCLFTTNNPCGELGLFDCVPTTFLLSQQVRPSTSLGCLVFIACVWFPSVAISRQRPLPQRELHSRETPTCCCANGAAERILHFCTAYKSHAHTPVSPYPALSLPHLGCSSCSETTVCIETFRRQPIDPMRIFCIYISHDSTHPWLKQPDLDEVTSWCVWSQNGSDGHIGCDSAASSFLAGVNPVSDCIDRVHTVHE